MEPPTLEVRTAPRRLVARCAVGVALLAIAVAARAQLGMGMVGMVGTLGDSSRVLAVAPGARPGYLAPAADPRFHTRLLRVTNDAGLSAAPIETSWGTDARHVYSKQQPWNATGTLLTVENRGAGVHVSPLILDGETYQPLFTPCAAYDHWDYRWQPSPDH